MRFLLVNVPTLWLGVGIVVLAVGLSLLGLVVVRRSVPLETLKENQDVAGFVIAVVGVIYAVLLAFVVVIVWEDFGSADRTAGNEAVAVGDLYRDAVGVGGSQGRRLETAVKAYALSVVESEWPHMAAHQSGTGETENALNVVWSDVKRLSEPASATTSGDFVQAAIHDASTATEERRSRILQSSSQIPGTLWAVLIAGAIITITFTYLFGVDTLRHHALMVSALATLIGLSLLVILTLNLPYTGDVAVKPEAMQNAIESFSPAMF
ncbi:MAG: DUF4239 domain-containing protein [Solirubrobacteraceae bacterium]